MWHPTHHHPPTPPSHVMTKLKKDENLVGIIQGSKVSYAKGLKNVWENWIGQDLHPKRNVKRRSLYL